MTSEQHLQILLVEDDPDTGALIKETLEDHFGVGCVTRCETCAQVTNANLEHVDIVLSDMNLPDGSGLIVLSNLLKRRPDLPIVLVTGEGILENALRAIRSGAYDYIVKAGDYLWSLPLVVEKNLAIWRTKKENQSLHEQLTRTLDEVRVKNEQLEIAVHQLETMALTDPLTGLANRRAFNESLERCFHEAERYGHDLACLMIDLDGFKPLNDTLGHPRGDQLLITVGKVLQANSRKSDICGRFGGDEFVVLLPQTDEETARTVARRIHEQFLTSADLLFADTPIAGRVGMSMGLACLQTSRTASSEQLIAHADHALYKSKQSGRGRLTLYRPPVADNASAPATPSPADTGSVVI